MLKKLINIKSLLMILALQFDLQAQGGWKNKYYLSGSSTSECRDVLEAPNGNIIMSGAVIVGGEQKLCIAATDPAGNFLWRKDYGNNKFLYYDNNMHLGGPLLKEGNFFYQALCVRDSNNRQIGVLQKFNFNGDTIWQRVYRDPDPLEDVVPQGLCKSVDGGFLITGFFQNSGSSPYSKSMVIKTDANGHELWRKKIGKTPPDMVEVQDGKSIVQDSATKKIVICGYQYLGGGAASFGNILILDSLGTKLVQTTYNNANGDPFYQVVQTRDKNFLVCGSYNSFQNQSSSIIRYYSFLAKFDISGNLIWQKKYDTISRFHSMGRIHETENGDLVVAGHLDTVLNYPPGTGPGSRTTIQLYRLDLNGNVKFKKYVGAVRKQYDDELIRGMNVCQDGGFIIAAWNAFSPPPHAFNVIRVDSNFCDTLEAWCQSVALGLDDRNRESPYTLRMFPNPADGQLTIDVQSSSGDVKCLAIQVSDLCGREVQHLKILGSEQNMSLSTANYSPGTYFISLKQGDKIVARQKLLIIH